MARNLTAYLEATARRVPDHPALVDSTGTTVSYGELDRQANTLAGFLAASGVVPGDRVAVVLPKSIASVVSLFGVMKAGAAYVPIDWTAPAERGRRILADCGIRTLIADSRVAGALTAGCATGEGPQRVVAVGGAGSPDTGEGVTEYARALEHCGPAPAREASDSDLAYVLYTSGSTGMPKGAMISHGNAVSFVEWCASEFAFTGEDRVTSNAPFHFDLSVLDLYTTVRNGATLYLISEDLGRNANELARFAARHRLTVWTSTPSVLMLLVEHASLASHDLSSLRLVLFGGEVFPIRPLRQLRREWSGPVFYNLYGPTEITTACTFARLPSVMPDDRETPYPIGFPCTHCQAIVLDGQGREVPPGGEGLLFISGPSVFGGYWNRPAENAAAFLDRDGTRWYNTGDVVRHDPVEGFVYVGRRDRMVKRRGFRIELGEIESALYAHPGVREAAVVAVPDERAGGVRIVAFVAPAGADGPTSIDLKTFSVTKVPAYMTPDRFVFSDRLPRTSTDKVDYQALLERIEPSRKSA